MLREATEAAGSARRESADVGASETTTAGVPTVACSRCGAAIARHEPLVVSSAGEAHRSTLALEPHAPEGSVFHPECFAASGGRLTAPRAERLINEALCGIDGSEASFAALEQAAALVGPGGGVTALVVTSLRRETGQMPGYDAAELVERACSLAEAAEVSCVVEVDPARPVHTVVSDWATGHELLAIGAPPRSILAGMLFGSVAGTALRELSTPILFARPAGPSGFARRVMVASDGYEGSGELVGFAERLARETDAALTLLHAPGRHAGGERTEVERQAGSISREGIDGEVLALGSGMPGDAIIEAAERLDASPVVLCSRRRTGPATLGSVSRRVVHHGASSVLVVPPERLAAAR